jgi:hypothetical protein
MAIPTTKNEYRTLSNILTELQQIVNRENKRHMMDQHLTLSCLALLEEEIIPMLENELDCDYEPDELGEPPLTMDEMHTAAWKEHQEMHR